MADTRKIRCIIVDDEPLAIQILTDYVAKIPALELVASCGNALEALSVLKEKQVDLIFLDIQMPELTGLEMLDILQEKPFIIFTTAFPDYALDGFNHDAVDYLLKPIPLARFFKAVEKVADRMQSQHKTEGSQTVQQTVVPQSEVKKHIFIKTEYKIVRLDLADILRIEGLKDYIKIYTKEEMLLTLMGMAEIEKDLPNQQFARIHKSHIVALQHIDSIERNRVIIQGEHIPVGATYKDAFFEKIGV